MKKKTPFAILEQIEPLVTEFKDFVKADFNSPNYRILDSHPDSDFFYEIIGSENTNNRWIVKIKVKPQRKESIKEVVKDIEMLELSNSFKAWLKLVKQSTELKSIYDDPIIESYNKEFFQDFKLTDDDAEFVPFNLNQQLIIDQHLNLIIQCLNTYKESASESEKIELLVIEAETIELKKTFTKLSKRQVLNKLARIWSLSRKYGLVLFQAIQKEGTEQIAKFIISQGVEIIKGYIENK